jgi:hypothetical protein
MRRIVTVHKTVAEASLMERCTKKMNLALIRVAQLDLSDKRPEEISLGDVVGHLGRIGISNSLRIVGGYLNMRCVVGNVVLNDGA